MTTATLTNNFNVTTEDSSKARTGICPAPSKADKSRAYRPDDFRCGSREFCLHLDVLLGKGSYSKVVRAVDTRTGEHVAAKLIDLRRHRKEFEREISIMSQIDHPLIVRYIGGETTSDDIGIIFMEMLPSTTLETYVMKRRRLKEKAALDIFQQLLVVVQYLAQIGISHHDLKPENITYNERTKEIRLFDFGLAVQTHGRRTNTLSGSPLYMAPEILSRKSHCPIKSDSWALGVILYFMLVGETPFHGATDLDDLTAKVLSSAYKMPSFLNYGTVALIQGHLEHEIRHRITLDYSSECASIIRKSL